MRIRKKQIVAHAFGVQLAIGAPRFAPGSAPAGVRTEFMSGTRRRVGSGTLPIGLRLHPDGLFEPILKIGALQNGAKIEAPVLGSAFQNGANRKS